jgi:hypothetical protein
MNTKTHALLHLLWSKASNTEGYDKSEWRTLEATIGDEREDLRASLATAVGLMERLVAQQDEAWRVLWRQEPGGYSVTGPADLTLSQDIRAWLAAHKQGDGR